jgi:trk system potassium uptake protein TrkA
MNIIILGAGQVGSTVARNLATEDNDITVVDTSVDVLQALQGDLDIRTVVGRASSPVVLEEAGARDADLILAVTNSDETNMTACHVAHSLFHTATLIARIRSADYLAHPELFSREAIPVDVVISPEQVVTRYVLGLIEYPASLQIHEFARGRVAVVGLRVRAGGRLVGRPFGSLAADLPGVPARILAVYRDDRILPLLGEAVRPDDEVFFVCARKDVLAVAKEFLELERPDRRVTIAGGGNVGMSLARSLEHDFHVKIIERDRMRANALGEALSRAVVLHGDATDKGLMVDEDVDDTDVFCALTNDDEDNIMAALQAKHLGARRVIALINRPSYVELMEDNPAIDVVVSPQQVTMGAILPHVRRGDVVRAYSLRGGEAEALEAIVHGDPKSSKIVGRRIGELALPPDATVAAIVRGRDVLIARDDLVVEAEDHLILLLSDKRQLRALERLLQVSVHFL